MDLFTYLLKSKGKNSYPHKSDLFAYLLGSGYPSEKTATGEEIEIEAEKTRVLELTLDKESTQDGTPTPSSPVEVKTVKGYENAKDLYNTRFISQNNGVISYSDEKYTITAPNEFAGGRYVDQDLLLKPNTTYTFSAKVLSTEATNGSSVRVSAQYTDNNAEKWGNYAKAGERSYATFTTPSTIISDNNSFIGMFPTQANTTTVFTDVMLVEGNQQLPYVPYGTNWIYTTITGKNLFNIQTIVKGRLDSGVIGYASNTTNLTLNENDFSFTTNANYRGVTSDYIEVKPSTEYVYKQKTIMTGLSYTSACYDENKNYLGSATTVSLNDYSKKYTMLANTKYFRLNVQLNATGTTTIEEPQLVEGNQATTYEAYQEKITTLPLNDNEIVGIGDYKDEYIVDKNGHCWLNKKTQKYTFDGTENWEYEYLSEERHNFYLLNLNRGVRYAGLFNNIGQYYTSLSFNYNCFINTTAFNYLCNEYNNITNFKNMLSNQNMIIYYVLETANLIDLNYNVDITLFKGSNTITNSENANMTIKYY